MLFRSGCGTGLAGADFHPFAAQLVGVDLSPAIVARAQAKDLYDRLVVGNLSNVLPDEIKRGAKYDLVIAADVFVYVNDLSKIVVYVARILATTGIFAFTVETHAGAGVELLPTLRFAYGEQYLREAVAAGGLKLLALEKAGIRTDKAAPVAGLVVVAST